MQPEGDILPGGKTTISYGGWGLKSYFTLSFSGAEQVSSLCVCLTASEELMNGLFYETSLMSKNETKRMW